MEPLLLLLVSQLATPGAELDAQIADLTARVAALESSPSTQVTGVYVATDYISDPGDGLGNDLSAALWRIQRLPGCSGPQRSQGCEVVIPAGQYQTRMIRVCKGMRIRGVGTGGPNAPTQITTTGTTAFWVASPSSCKDLVVGDGCDTDAQVDAQGGACPSGVGSIIEAMRLNDDAGTSTTTPIISAGLFAETVVHGRDLYIDRFTQGVRINAGVTDRPNDGVTTYGWSFARRTNANRSTLINVTVVRSRHAGLYTRGADANAGWFASVDVSTNCLEGDRYVREFGFPGVLDTDGLLKCAGLYERSFLGNAYVAPVAHLSVAEQSGEVQLQMAVDPNNANNTTTLLNPYGEEGTIVNGRTFLSGGTLSLGGALNVDGTSKGTVWYRGNWNGGAFQSRNPDNTAGSVIRLGNHAAGPSVVEISATVAPFSSAEPVRIEHKQRGADRVLNIATSNFNFGVGDIKLNDDPAFRTGSWIQYSRPLLQGCGTAPVDSNLDGMSVISDSFGVSACAAP